MLVSLTVFELRLIYQYLLGRVFGTEQVPGTPADRLTSLVAFFVFLAGMEGFLAADKRHGKGAPTFLMNTWISQLGTA